MRKKMRVNPQYPDEISVEKFLDRVGMKIFAGGGYAYPGAMYNDADIRLRQDSFYGGSNRVRVTDIERYRVYLSTAWKSAYFRGRTPRGGIDNMPVFGEKLGRS